MRAFIALELPEAFEDELAALARMLHRSVGGRFMRRETYHLTLAFLGEIDEVTVRDAIAALDEAGAARDAVPLVPDGLGSFGRGRNATLWLGIAPAPALMSLAEGVRAALVAREVAYDDGKPFRPHITLARRVTMPSALPQLPFPRPDEVRALTLFKSTLAPDGAQYKPLYTVALG